MSVRINDVAPNFTADSTQGRITFHDWIGDSYAILFSHPKDFTPVCTTEFGAVAGIQSLGQFDRLSMEAGPVVRTGLDGLGKNRAVVIPGATNKAGALSTRFAPRSFVRKIAGSLKF